MLSMAEVRISQDPDWGCLTAVLSISGWKNMSTFNSSHCVGSEASCSSLKQFSPMSGQGNFRKCGIVSTSLRSSQEIMRMLKAQGLVQPHNGSPWTLPAPCSSWIISVLNLCIACNVTPITDCFWVGGGGNTQSSPCMLLPELT